MVSHFLNTTMTSKTLNKSNINYNKDSNIMKKKIFHKRDRPTDLLEGILYDMEYLHSLLRSSKSPPSQPPTKPGYQNYAEI